MKKAGKDKKTEDRILEAATRIFMTRGMAGARMQDIADQAGINKALLHYYFSNKEKLFEVIFIREAQKFFPKIKMIFEADLPLMEKFERFADEYITEMLENPYLPWFVMNEINQNPDKFLYKVWGKNNLPRPEKFLEQIEAEVKKGRIKRISPLQLFLNLLSMCIFPFVAKPMLQRNLGIDELQFRHLMEMRKKEIPHFIMESIKK